MIDPAVMTGVGGWSSSTDKEGLDAFCLDCLYQEQARE